MNAKSAARLAALENTLRADADVLSPAQVAELNRAIARLKGITPETAIDVTPVAVVDVDRARLMAATDAVIAEDVATGNTEVGTLATRVAAKLAAVESPKVTAENAKRAAAGKPKMTAAEAKHFETYSESNATIVEQACENGCEAYVDVFTFKRWIAQGFVVKKGEHATKITVYSKKEIVESDGSKRWIKIGRQVPVFCRCQVKRLEGKAKRAA